MLPSRYVIIYTVWQVNHGFAKEMIAGIAGGEVSGVDEVLFLLAEKVNDFTDKWLFRWTVWLRPRGWTLSTVSAPSTRPSSRP